MRPCLAHPRQLRWEAGVAQFESGNANSDRPLAAVVRFYQGEWLARLPRNVGWECLFVGGRTPVTNPGITLLTESKRFPLAWDAGRRRGLFGAERPACGTPMPTWRQLLPETRDPRDAPWSAATAGSSSRPSAIPATMSPRGTGRTSRTDTTGSTAGLSRGLAGNPATPRGVGGAATIRGRPARHAPGENVPVHWRVYRQRKGRRRPRPAVRPGPLIDYAAIDAAVLIEECDEQT